MDGDNCYLNSYLSRGLESEEKQIINSLVSKVLGFTYFRDSDIPDCPKIGGSELFSFTDEAIPKIENTKRIYSSEKHNNIDILESLNITSDTKVTPELIKTLTTKIHNNEFSSEDKAKIVNFLTTHLKGK